MRVRVFTYDNEGIYAREDVKDLSGLRQSKDDDSFDASGAAIDGNIGRVLLDR